jgi:hypothetical protein
VRQRHEGRLTVRAAREPDEAACADTVTIDIADMLSCSLLGVIRGEEPQVNEVVEERSTGPGDGVF